MMINDVARAFFEAPVNRDICIELPAEAKTEEDVEGMVVQSLYGTRDAAKNFQDEVQEFMVGSGYMQGKYNLCTYYRRGWQMSVGGRESPQWLREKLQECFEIKTAVIGLHVEERILKRVVRVTDKG